MAKTCTNCISAKDTVGLRDMPPVPFAAHEAEVARQERHIKRMWIALIVAVALVFASNALWLWAWMQYDYESYEITADGDSNANYIGQDGNIYNGGFNQSEEESAEE